MGVLEWHNLGCSYKGAGGSKAVLQVCVSAPWAHVIAPVVCMSLVFVCGSPPVVPLQRHHPAFPLVGCTSHMPQAVN